MNPINTEPIALSRSTAETTIDLSLFRSDNPQALVETGIGFLDHMLRALAIHGRLDLTLRATGDLEVDDHHTVEDCAIVLGQALDRLLGSRQHIRRFGYAYAPLDESLSRCVIDLVTRPSAVVALQLQREKVGELSCENVAHFFSTLAVQGRFTLHLDVLRGDNDHHKIESAFKAFALALRQATEPDAHVAITSTKGKL